MERENYGRMSLRFNDVAGRVVSEVAPSFAKPSAAAPIGLVSGALPAVDDTTPPPRRRLPVVRLKGVELHAVTEQEAIEHVLEELDHHRGGTVVTPNLDILRRCTKDLHFAALVSEADVVVPDGMPLVWAAKLQGTPLPQRVAGSDLITSLNLAAAKRGKTVFFLGGAPGTAEGAAEVLKKRCPDLIVLGTYCPPFGFEDKPEEMTRLIALLEEKRPDIVWVALGSPKQEYLIDRIREVLPESWWLGVGVSFSFLTGQVRRAPRWMQKLGLEWTHRLMQEPRRLFKRYVMVGMPFAGKLMLSALVHRFTVEGGSTDGHRYRGRRKHLGANPFTRANAPLPWTATETLSDPNADSGILHVPGTQTEHVRFDGQLFTRNDGLPAGQGLKRLKAVVLLGGKVRETQLTLSIGRSVLDLPLDDSGSILNHWLAHTADLARFAGLDQLPVRVMVEQTGPEPTSAAPRFKAGLTVERDRSSFRGTGGLLADITADYDDNDLILVATAAQVLLDPLHAIAAALHHKRGEANVINHRDGTASGLMLLSVRTLRGIPSVGYCDMKEQALPRIAQQYPVRVVNCRQPTAIPVRTLGDYIGALQQYHRRREQRRNRTNPFGEDFGRHFAIIEDGASVDPSAYVHDAVVLRGTVVEPGAAVIRSLVCPGSVVRRDKQVVDQFVCTR